MGGVVVETLVLHFWPKHWYLRMKTWPKLNKLFKYYIPIDTIAYITVLITMLTIILILIRLNQENIVSLVYTVIEVYQDVHT